MNEGSYQALGALNRTDFDALTASTASNGARCTRLSQATCYRSRESLGKAFTGIQAQAGAPQQSQIAQVCHCSPESCAPLSLCA